MRTGLILHLKFPLRYSPESAHSHTEFFSKYKLESRSSRKDIAFNVRLGDARGRKLWFVSVSLTIKMDSSC